MAGAVLERELRRRGRVEFSVASRDDDLEIRALLRETPMAGRISLSLEREPNYFAEDDLLGGTRQTILARDGGRVVTVGSCVTRELFVNGRACRVGYLGALRMAGDYAGRADILRRGYQFFRVLQEGQPAEFYFTSIASDNARARQFLERGLAGMPIYEFVGDYATVVLRSGGSRPMARDGFWEELRGQFALAGKQMLGPTLWDQRAFKQTVVRGYSGMLRLLRPILGLPRVGEALSNAFVFNLASLNDSVAKGLRGEAARRGIKWVTFGFDGRDPRLPLLRRAFRCHVYWSRIYVVRWPGLGRGAAELDGRLLAPEVALL